MAGERWTKREHDLIVETIRRHRRIYLPDVLQVLEAAGVHRTYAAVDNYLRRLHHHPEFRQYVRPAASEPLEAASGPPSELPPQPPADTLETKILNALKKRKSIDLAQLSELCDRSVASVRRTVEALQKRGSLVNVIEDNLVQCPEPQTGGSHTVDLRRFAGQPIRFGFVSDSHLGSKYARLDVLQVLYDLFEREGIRDVYHGGNWIDGESRFNVHDLLVHGFQRQIGYFLEHYPHRKGITTHLIAGDDHEGWYAQREGVDVGQILHLSAQEAGRSDLHYLGYLEADVAFRAPKGTCMMRIMHPGGGTAYATSYTAQKIAESYTGGEKPQILLLGHFHKFNVDYPRQIWVVQMGCTQDQTPWMRKRKITSHVGGGIITLQLAEDGSISRFQTEFLPFYDKGFHQKYERF